jgi:hypothetical protein
VEAQTVDAITVPESRAVIAWAADLEIFFSPTRPYKKNDQATIESKNNNLVRKFGFHYRYDTREERAARNRLWKFVNDRLNHLTTTKKPVGFGTDRNGSLLGVPNCSLGLGLRRSRRGLEACRGELALSTAGLMPLTARRTVPSRSREKRWGP